MANSNGGIVGNDDPIKFQAEQITTFTGTGTFTTQPLTTQIEYLVVAGGGGGAARNYAGGGGAGGFRTATGSPVSGNTGYPVTIGGGGAGGLSFLDSGTKGSDTILGIPSPITSEGGGYGTGCGPTGYKNASPGGPGGSGRGTGPCMDNEPVYPATGGVGTPGQGNPGGSGNMPSVANQYRNCGSGGGGAGQAGVDATAGIQVGGIGTGSLGFTIAGPGGNGLSSSITGSPVYYAGGGGGGGYGDNWNGAGGYGGGGAGAGGGDGPVAPGSAPNTAAVAGTANTGGGGGGAAQTNQPLGAAGGSGIVIIKEAKVFKSASGVWDMNSLYDNVKSETWTNA
jgi:hypothetical protein